LEALVTVETILLVLLSLLVAGLLRSHAEILRRLDSGTGGEAPGRPEELPPARPESTAAFDIVGTTLNREAIKVTVRGASNTLLAFLSSGCLSCHSLWEGLDEQVRPRIPGGARIVVVTKDSAYESPSKLRRLAPPGVTLVMSSDAWGAYRVQGSPYFIYVEGRTGTIIGEGTASGWPQVLSLIRDAFADAELAAADDRADKASARPERGSADRARRAEAELLAAGIGPGHPSLYGRAEDLEEPGPVTGDPSPDGAGRADA
jgi:hypothetical protein